jgi:hypothetical protein
VLNLLKSFTDRDFISDPKFSDPFVPVSCPGDCNYDNAVTVDELLTGVGIALDASHLAACVAADPNGDGAVTVDELLGAVDQALAGCPSPPQPTPSPTPGVDASPTPGTGG